MRSSPQIEHHKNKVDYRSVEVGGGQHVTTLDNYKVPTSIMNALSYMPLRPHIDKELEELPHLILTYDMHWDPTVLDCEGQCYDDTWFDAQSSFPDVPNNKIFD